MSTYSAMIRLLGEDLWLARSDCEVSFRDLEHLGIVQFPIICAVAEGLVFVSRDGTSHSQERRTCGVCWLTGVLYLNLATKAATSGHCEGEKYMAEKLLV